MARVADPVRRRTPIAGMLAVLLSVVGCAGNESIQSTCKSNAECPESRFCDARGQCERECDPSAVTSACEIGERCTDRGECLPNSACRADSGCTSPPEPFCAGSSRVGYTSPGTCTEVGRGPGTCEYAEQRETCQGGCRDGACAGPCRAVDCDDPPADTCSGDGSTRIVHESPGSCTVEDGSAECAYDTKQKACAHGCADGACRQGTCEGVVCDSPPSPTCKGDRLVRYDSDGTCEPSSGSGPSCTYPEQIEYCAHSGGRCRNGDCVEMIDQKGPLVITEFMADPAGADEDDREWFEVHNAGSSAVDLDGWRIESRHDSAHSISTSTGAGSIPAGRRALLAESDDPAGDGSVPVDYVYEGITLRNDGDTVRLVRPSGATSDFLRYRAGVLIDGRARKYRQGAPKDPEANDDVRDWCPSLSSVEQYGRWSDRGSPGRRNPTCASSPCDTYTCSRPTPFCKDGKAIRPTKPTATCRVTSVNNPRCDYDVQTFTCSSDELCGEGRCRSTPANLPAAGELVITETMGDPSAVPDSDGEWLEVYNPTGSAKSLFTLVLSDGESGQSEDRYTIRAPNAQVPAGGYAVLAVESDAADNGGIQGAIRYEDVSLVNSPSGGFAPSLERQDGTLVDRAHYGTPREGVSQQLSRSSYVPGSVDGSTENDRGSNWCAGQTIYGQGDRGTPGRANTSCP